MNIIKFCKLIAIPLSSLYVQWQEGKEREEDSCNLKWKFEPILWLILDAKDDVE